MRVGEIAHDGSAQPWIRIVQILKDNEEEWYSYEIAAARESKNFRRLKQGGKKKFG